MQLSEVLENIELKKRGIVVIGFWKAGDHEFAVLARRGEKVFPVPKLFHLIEVSPEDRNPKVSSAEMRSILERFKFFEAISNLHTE